VSKIPDRVWLSADRQWAKSQTPICTEEYVRAALRSDPAEGRWTIGRTDLRSYTADGRRVQYLYPPEEEGQRIPFYGEDCVERAQLVCGLLNASSAPAPASSGGEREGWMSATCKHATAARFDFVGIPDDAVPGTIHSRDGDPDGRLTDLRIRCPGDVTSQVLPNEIYLLPRNAFDDTGTKR